MRLSPRQPAEQLRSVSLRFDLPSAWHSLRAAVSEARANDSGAPPDRLSAVARHAEHDSDLARLEAVLLLAREPLSSRKLSQFANLADGTQARTLVRRLNAGYDGAGRAFRVEHVAGGYQLFTRREFAPWLRRLAHVPGEMRLSAPTLETLAVIAYRQPVPRADIEAIRGVNCGELLRQLIDRELVRISGRSAELGRPFLYSTTKRFLQLFGLISTDDLPRAEVLRQAPLPTRGPLPSPLPSDDNSDSPEPNDDQNDDPLTAEIDDDYAIDLSAADD
jgi:segregation and condensation protein B